MTTFFADKSPKDRGARIIRWLRRWWREMVVAAIGVAASAYGFYRAAQDWRKAIVLFVTIALLIGAVTLAERKKARELVALLLGLALGGQLWILTLLYGEPQQQLLPFLQDHAFDYFAAGGLAGFTLYFLREREARWRVPSTVAVFTVIGATTGFSTHLGLTPIAEGIGGGVALGLFTAVAFRWWLTELTDSKPGRLS